MLIRHMSFRAALLGSAFALVAFSASAQTGGYKVLHNFAGPPSDGSYSYNNLTFGAGYIIGTTNLGGSSNNGTIFKIEWQGYGEAVLYSFAGGSQGSDPNGGAVTDSTYKNVYGTTTFGGNGGCRNGCGVLYHYSLANSTYTVLHTFDPGKDGESPVGTLLRDRQGNLFGVAGGGGSKNGGTVFEYSATGAFSVLHAFGGSDGFQPVGNLMTDKHGNLYGATNSGGAQQYGTLFKLSRAGKLTTLYSFTGGADGGYPTGGLAARGSSGDLYGVTNLAGNGTTPYGTVFRLAPNGTLSTLYAFQNGNDGGYPAGNLVELGNKLYGTTTSGGAGQDGVIYEVNPASGTETVLHSFSGADGASPQAGLAKASLDELVGTTGGGGADNYGVVFLLKRKK